MCSPGLANVNFTGVLNVNGNRTFNNVFLIDGVENISSRIRSAGENVLVLSASR